MAMVLILLPNFSVSLIIPKTDTATIEKINRAIKAAYEEGQSKLLCNSRFVPDLESLKLPLRDGDKEHKGDPAYTGCMFINANSSTAPGIVDADCNPILDRSEVYSGVYGRAGINLYDEIVYMSARSKHAVPCDVAVSGLRFQAGRALGMRVTLPPPMPRTSPSRMHTPHLCRWIAGRQAVPAQFPCPGIPFPRYPDPRELTDEGMHRQASPGFQVYSCQAFVLYSAQFLRR